MAEYTVKESDKFGVDLEEALIWLYFHNLEQSQAFADQKALELKQEIKNLKLYLTKTPYMGRADDVSGLRRFPLYEGRYAATWSIDENARFVTLLEFIDSRYPQELREFHFDE